MAWRGLLFFFLFLIVLWRWRQWRDGKERIEKREKEAFSEIVACRHCGVHLPLADAVRGKHGHFYCSIVHKDSV